MGKTSIQTFQNIVQLKGLEFKSTVDEDARHLIINLLRLNPEERIGAEDIQEVKQH